MDKKPVQVDQIQRIVTFLNKTDGRDKFCKTIQYLMRILKHVFLENKALAEKFGGLGGGMADARKFFRLFKTLNELQAVLDQFKNFNNFETRLLILQKLFLAAYWFFDNISILCKVKFVQKDFKPYAKTGMTFWFYSLLVAIVSDYYKLKSKDADIRKEQYVIRSQSQQNPQACDDARAKIQRLQREKFAVYLNFAKTFGDILPAGTGAEIFQKFFGKAPNEGLVGLGGLISAIISCYSLY